MVDFKLSEEQEMLRELANEFAAENVRPNAEHWDENSEFPMEAIEVAHDLGLMNLHVPEAYGGMGMGCLDEVIVQEEFAWGDPGFATAAYSNGLTAAPIITGGTEEQKAKYLGRLTEAPRIAAYAVTSDHLCSPSGLVVELHNRVPSVIVHNESFLFLQWL